LIEVRPRPVESATECVSPPTFAGQRFFELAHRCDRVDQLGLQPAASVDGQRKSGTAAAFNGDVRARKERQGPVRWSAGLLGYMPGQNRHH
jgi:hypothetical protein